ncbi:MAG: Clp protease N-terminal domain-containing protein, partial [Bacteroidota bacterium]
MQLNNFTIKSQEAVQRAAQMAMENRQQAIEVGHLLKAMLEVDDSLIPFLLKKLGVNTNIIKQAIDSHVTSMPTVSGEGQQYLSRTAGTMLQRANVEMKEM